MAHLESVRIPREDGRRRLSKHELRDMQVSDLGQVSKIIVAKNNTVVEGRSRDRQVVTTYFSLGPAGFHISENQELRESHNLSHSAQHCSRK